LKRSPSPPLEPEGSAAQQEYLLHLPLLVQKEVELLASGRRPALRAALRNLVPFLSGWFIARELSDPRSSSTPAPARRTVLARVFGRSVFPELRSALKRVVSKVEPQGGLHPSPLPPAVLLCVSLQPNSTRAFLPVARELGAELVCFLLDPADLDSQQQVRDAGVQFFCLPHVGGSHELLELAENAASIADLVGTSRLVALVEHCQGPHSSALGRGQLRRLQRAVSWQLIRGVSFAARLEQALKQLAPRQILYITHRALIDEVLRHRPEIERRIFYLQGIVPPVPPIFTPLHVDLAIAGSALDAPYLQRCGVSEQQMLLCGYPDYDGLGELNREVCARELTLKYSLAGGRPLVVFTSQYKTSAFPDWARELQLETVVETARQRPDLFFILKPHPRLEMFKGDWLTTLPENVAVEQKLPALRLLAGASVTVTYWSTTALESVLLGTPLVQLNATGLPDYFPLVTELGGRAARDVQSLSANISAALSEQGKECFVRARQRWLSEHRIVLDQRAASRVATHLRGFLLSPNSLTWLRSEP